MCQAKNFYIWLLQVIALLGLLVLCLWLALRPKEPSFTIVEFSVPKVTNQNSSATNDANQNHTLVYTVDISNSNKDSSVYYDDIHLTFYFGQDIAGKSKIPPFHQDAGKSIQDMDHVDSSEKVEGALVKAISNGKAEVKVDLSTKIRYKTWGVKSKHHRINLHASIPVGPDGKISGKKKKIKLSQKWKLAATRFL